MHNLYGQPIFIEVVDILNVVLQDEEIEQIDLVLRSLTMFLQHLEEQESTKEFHQYVCVLTNALLGSFTHEDIDNSGREKSL